MAAQLADLILRLFSLEVLPMYLTDYHCHSILSADGVVPLSVMAQRALDAGMSEICITDHFDLLTLDGKRVYDYDWAPALEQYHKTAPQFEGRLKLKLGMEFGSGHIDPAVSERVLSQPELDFVIGSVHNQSQDLGGMDFYNLGYTVPEDCYRALDDYFNSLERLASTPWYDVLGHIIYPLRYMHGLATMDRYYDRIAHILHTVVDAGKGIEVNTYRGRTVADWLPVLERYRDAGGELVTVGSDAHDPAYTGAGVREAYELLERLGFRYVTVYEKRRPQMVKL